MTDANYNGILMNNTHNWYYISARYERSYRGALCNEMCIAMVPKNFVSSLPPQKLFFCVRNSRVRMA